MADHQPLMKCSNNKELIFVRASNITPENKSPFRSRVGADLQDYGESFFRAVIILLVFGPPIFGWDGTVQAAKQGEMDDIEINQWQSHLSKDDVGYRTEFDLAQLRATAERIYSAEMHSVLQEEHWNVGEVWILSEILKLGPDDQLSQFVKAKIDALSGDPFLRIVNPKAPLVWLPKDPGSGRKRFYTYMLAAVGTPTARALSYINKFLSSSANGYVLTHQFLALAWFEQTNSELPIDLKEKQRAILRRISAEQAGAESFSDLYAERFAILLHFSKPSASDAHRWMHTMVNAYLENGMWVRYSESMVYDGETIIGTPGVNHTRVLALLSIRLYLDQY